MESTHIGPAVVWLTGLSASGKTTIASHFQAELKKNGHGVVILDGDDIRLKSGLNKFDEDSRKTHNLNVGHIAAKLEKEGKLVIVALISPYADVRKHVRRLCSRFFEVYVSTDLATCISRDPKGLYKKALAGEIENFTGISAPYEAPLAPDLVLDSAVNSAESCVKEIIDLLKRIRP